MDTSVVRTSRHRRLLSSSSTRCAQWNVARMATDRDRRTDIYRHRL